MTSRTIWPRSTESPQLRLRSTDVDYRASRARASASSGKSGSASFQYSSAWRSFSGPALSTSRYEARLFFGRDVVREERAWWTDSFQNERIAVNDPLAIEPDAAWPEPPPGRVRRSAPGDFSGAMVRTFRGVPAHDRTRA